ncbi:Chitin bind 4 domain containing protein [Asbolus verrucosus]|uniref:Chitin bind 4 domain containing protein n=1 Tax=Asbolus verrucosus TaxID=1661398 RepID=A0A482VJH1_ASBVE|nr:Chitin bind 4 domain containing protein [Asbolus verrucosus]
MTLKLFIIACLMVSASGGLIGTPVVRLAPVVPDPQYSFAYDVKDSLTGDFKSQVESRSGGVVRGQYSVIDPDGTKRIVDYTADPINGFNAIVRKAPITKVLAPVVAAPAPIVAAPTFARVAPLVPKPALPVGIPAPVTYRLF